MLLAKACVCACLCSYSIDGADRPISENSSVSVRVKTKNASEVLKGTCVSSVFALVALNRMKNKNTPISVRLKTEQVSSKGRGLGPRAGRVMEEAKLFSGLKYRMVCACVFGHTC